MDWNQDRVNKIRLLTQKIGKNLDSAGRQLSRLRRLAKVNDAAGLESALLSLSPDLDALIAIRQELHSTPVPPGEAGMKLQAVPLAATGSVMTNDKMLEALTKDNDRFRQLIDALQKSAIVAVTDKRGIITSVNEMFCQISGFAEDELVGQNHRIVNSGVHSRAFFRNLWMTIASGHVWSGEIENRAKNGSHYLVQTVISPVLNAFGKIDEYISVRFDVTQARRSAQLLREAESIAKLGNWLFDLTSGGLIWSSEQYHIFEIYEPQPSEALYALFRKRIHPDDQAGLDAIQKTAIEGGKDFECSYRICFDDGRVKHVLAIGRLKNDHTGRPISIQGTCQDVTERIAKDLELESERQKSLRSAKLAALGELAAGVAHEINNPAAIIQGIAYTLPKFALQPEKLQEKVHTIEKAVTRIVKIAAGLKKFSHSTVSSDRGHFKIFDIITECVFLTESKSNRHGTPVKVLGKSDVKIFCNEIEIEQVFVNLINNAIDAVKNLEDKWVLIEIFDDEHQAGIRIRDSGAGIPVAAQKNLFQAFYTTKPVGEGTGLGLSIVKGILERHEASIELLNLEPNTCFEVLFPIAVNLSVVA